MMGMRDFVWVCEGVGICVFVMLEMIFICFVECSTGYPKIIQSDNGGEFIDQAV